MHDVDAKVWGVAALGLLALAAISAGAHAIGIDRESFVQMLTLLGGWAAVFGGLSYFLGIGAMRQWWPVALACLWFCLAPAVSYWGIDHIGTDGGILTDSTIQESGPRAFWSTGWFEFVAGTLIVGLGYYFDRDSRPWGN